VDPRAPRIYKFFKIPALKQALGGIALIKTYQLEPLLKFLVQPLGGERRDMPLVPFFLPSSSIPPLARRTEEPSKPLAAPIPLTPDTESISPYTSLRISPPPSDEEDHEDSGVGSEDCQAEAVGDNTNTPQGRPTKRRKLLAARKL
jgi:hypothetical protein